MPRAAMRVALAFAWLLLAVGGCTSWPPSSAPPLRPPSPVSPDAQAQAGRLARLLRIADDEWRHWGARTARTTEDGRLCLVQGDACLPVDDGCGDEQSAALCPRVTDFWTAVRPGSARRFMHDCSRTDVCVARWPADTPLRPVDTPAWSAAFIGWLFVRAGFDADAFRPTPYHADHVAAARDRSTWAFDAVPTPAEAAPGDLICATRFAHRPPLRPDELWRVRPSTVIGGPTPMHCDLVVAVDAAARTLDAIGGNVMQTVARITVALDEAGRVAPETDPARPWLVVLRLAPAYR